MAKLARCVEAPALTRRRVFPKGFWLPWGAACAPPALPAPSESALEAAENAGSGRRFSVGEGIDIRRFLRPVSTPELVQVRKFASLSAFAYLIESVTVRGHRSLGGWRQCKRGPPGKLLLD